MGLCHQRGSLCGGEDHHSLRLDHRGFSKPAPCTFIYYPLWQPWFLRLPKGWWKVTMPHGMTAVFSIPGKNTMLLCSTYRNCTKTKEFLFSSVPTRCFRLTTSKIVIAAVKGKSLLESFLTYIRSLYATASLAPSAVTAVGIVHRLSFSLLS